MKQKLGSVFRPVNPSPASLITSADGDGKPNVMTAGEVFNISIANPVIVGIAIRPATFTHSLIQATGEYVINLTTSKLAASVDRCGSVSGRSGIDKFRDFGLTPIPASFVKAPLIDECPVNVECKVIDIRPIGDHDLILGNVLAVHAAESALDKDGNLAMDRLDLLIYLNGGYWMLGSKIGNQGFSSVR